MTWNKNEMKIVLNNSIWKYNTIRGYWNIPPPPAPSLFWIETVWFFWSKNLNQFSLKTIHKDVILFKIFDKCWGQNNSILQEVKCFNIPISYPIDAHFYKPSVKIDSLSFLSFDMRNFHHLLGRHTIGINSSLIFFYVLCVFPIQYSKPKVW